MSQQPDLTEIVDSSPEHKNPGPDFGRHADFVGPGNIDGTLHVVGCGATGSHIALLAARMGFLKFDLWDADGVEPHNLANQTFTPRHIGQNKAKALAHVLCEFNPAIKVTINDCFFDEKSDFAEAGPLVLTVDTMSGRKLIAEKARNNINVDGVFETRLGFNYGESMRFDNFEDDEVDGYLATLVKDEDVEEGPCNRKICTTFVQVVAGFTVHQLCELYAARTAEKKYAAPKRTVFSMDPGLLVKQLA